MDLVVITGAMGALGSTIVELIKENKIRKDHTFGKTKLILCDFFPEDIKNEYINLVTEISEDCYVISGDLTLQKKQKELTDLIKKLKIKSGYIVNTAASLKLSQEKEEILRVNTVLPCCLQKIAQKEGLRFIQISSCSIYKQLPIYSKDLINENDPLLATSNYEESKIKADQSLYKNSLTETVILRPGLIYGGKTRHLGSAVAAIPTIIKTLGLNKIPRIIGGPKTNWIHVKDLAAAVLEIIKEDKFKSTVYNIVEEKPFTFGQTISHVCDLSDINLGLIPFIIPKAKYFKRYLNKIIKRDISFKGINYILDKLWQKTEAYPYSKLNLSLEKEMCTYLEGDMIFDGRKFRRDFPSWECRYTQIKEDLCFNGQKDGWEESLNWYKKKGWI